MIDKPMNQLFNESFERFNYRLVYMQPSQHSDERIAVGLVAESRDGLEARFIASVGPLELMGRLLGDNGVEQFQFAASELKHSMRQEDALDDLSAPTDLLFLGDKTSAVTQDREGLLRGILASSSCLIRAEPARAREIPDEPVTRLCTKLYEHVSLMSPMAADDLFQKRVTVGSGDSLETVSLPIFGRKIFGAPVSFVTPGWDQKVRAEAYVAKFHWLRQFLSQEPNVYVLSPVRRSKQVSARSDTQMRELKAVADASNVRLRVSHSTEELAALIVNDEAA